MHTAWSWDVWGRGRLDGAASYLCGALGALELLGGLLLDGDVLLGLDFGHVAVLVGVKKWKS